ncbi:hypothetical protein [Deinococcus sonorensis]|uniref:Uncharacterized protein n=2 Tax=Deinococcus sonorensis TaxID=309891 RepID=A0AAU7U6I4_9DEIO
MANASSAPSRSGLVRRAAPPLRSRLTLRPQATGQVTSSDTAVLVSQWTSGDPRLRIGIGSWSRIPAGRVSRVTLDAQRVTLTRPKRTLFTRAATESTWDWEHFNLRPERKAAITTWLDVQNSWGFLEVAPDLGSVPLECSRSLDTTMDDSTKVWLSCDGRAPWINDGTP